MRKSIIEAYDAITSGDPQNWKLAVSSVNNQLLSNCISSVMLDDILKRSFSLDEITRNKPLLTLLNKVSNGETAQLFNNEFAANVKDVKAKLDIAIGNLIGNDSSCDADVKQMTNLLATATSALNGCTVIKLTEVNQGNQVTTNLNTHDRFMRFTDFTEAVNFASEHINSIALCRVLQVNGIDSRKDENKAFALYNNSNELIAVEFNENAKHGIPMMADNVEGQSISAQDELAILITIILSTTNILSGANQVKDGYFAKSKGKSSLLPTRTDTKAVELDDITPDALRYAKINSRYAWIDQFINDSDVAEIANLQQKRNSIGELTHYQLSTDSDNRTQWVIKEGKYNAQSMSNDVSLMAFNPNAMSSKEDLERSKLMVARFNKAALAQHCLIIAWGNQKPYKAEVLALLKKLDPQSLINIVGATLAKQMSEDSTRNFSGAQGHLYCDSVIQSFAKTTNSKVILESTDRTGTYGYSMWDRDKTPLVTMGGQQICKESNALKAAKCAITGTTAKYHAIVNLNNHELLKSLLVKSGDNYTSEFPALATRLQFIQYMPKFKSQTFGCATMSGINGYPTDRDVEDFIMNPYFSQCQFTIPLSEKGKKELLISNN
ncbi:hypothetical protein VCHA53O466_50026 [Vibrio chagasii]|nr:hypothetical protein VCHA53O466_50026 [Vibrio chagasii]